MSSSPLRPVSSTCLLDRSDINRHVSHRKCKSQRVQSHLSLLIVPGASPAQSAHTGLTERCTGETCSEVDKSAWASALVSHALPKPERD